MSSKYEALLATAIDDQPVSYTDGDAMLYALGVGFCSSPDNVKELPYAYESPALKTVPTFASMLPPSDFLADSGLEVARILLGGLRLELYRPLPAAADLDRKSTRLNSSHVKIS